SGRTAIRSGSSCSRIGIRSTFRFSKEALGVYPYRLRTGVPPTVVNTPQEVRERVDETPGAIGYAVE
ncbi:MAG: hypothetical protein ACREWE_05710, partial [Gammaproteobacteria bacterium]